MELISSQPEHYPTRENKETSTSYMIYIRIQMEIHQSYSLLYNAIKAITTRKKNWAEDVYLKSDTSRQAYKCSRNGKSLQHTNYSQVIRAKNAGEDKKHQVGSTMVTSPKEIWPDRKNKNQLTSPSMLF